MRSWQRYLCLPFVLWCSACSFFQPADRFGAAPVNYNALSGWQADNHAEALTAFIATCSTLQKSRPATSGSDLKIPADVWRSVCDDAKRVPRDDNVQARLFFEARFIPYRINNRDREEGLFTGYYVPRLYASAHKKGDYAYPLYKAPPGLEKQKPYYTHAQIDQGALDKKGLELVWVDDPVMLFFLQVQGSGRVRFDDGQEMLVGYAGQNGHPYISLGKIMGDEGLLAKDQINFYTIRQWLYDHKDQAFAMMERNPSYVFFKRLDQPGAVGAAGAVLTKQRSLAVDNRYIPYGLPLFVETDLPALPGSQPAAFHRLLIAQDTGGAIHGPVRGDIFFGEGGEAEYLAGYMKGHGVYSLLVPKEMANQLPSNVKE